MDKNLATLVGQLKVESLERGFVKAWEKGPAFGAEYVNGKTGTSVLLEVVPSLVWGAQAELDFYLRKEIQGKTLDEVQGCIDPFRQATERLERLGYRGTFELGDNTLNSWHRAKASNLQEFKNILDNFQEK